MESPDGASGGLLMRAWMVASLALCAGYGLAGCSKPSSPAPAAESAGAATAPSPPAELSEADQKAMLATLPQLYQGADLENGRSKLALCKACHTLGQGGEPEVGPNLFGVFGRKAGSAPGFSYSDGMKALGIVWDADKLNTWITKPSVMVPGTKMTFAGIENPKDRIDLIAALKVATSAPPK
jgi:cytochrome c